MAAILEAAAQLLVERGYATASTNAIARRAGVSVGSLYQYFAGKAEIFERLRMLHHEEVHPLVESALTQLESSPGRPGSVLGRLLHELARLHGERPALMRAMESELGRVGSDHDAAEEMGAVSRVARMLTRRGSATERQARSWAWLAVATTSTISRRLAHSPPDGLDTEAVVEGFRRMMEGLLE